MTPLEFAPHSAWLRRRESRAIHELPGFVRGRHRVPREFGAASERFVQSLANEAVIAEIEAVYSAAKRELGLRRRELAVAHAEGGANLDGPSFRYVIEVGHDPDQVERAAWLRELRLLVPASCLAEAFDRVFPPFDELVIPFRVALEPSGAFDEVVDRLEDFAQAFGGVVEDSQREGRASLVTRDGCRLRFDLGRAELTLQVPGCTTPLALLREAERRFQALAS